MSYPTATITPVFDAKMCDETGCENHELLARVEPETESQARVLCPHYRVKYLREVYSK